MSAQRGSKGFVPKECAPPGPFAARRIYGIEFTTAGLHAVHDAIKSHAEFTGYMDMFRLTMEVNDTLRRHYGMVDAFCDDIYIHICKDLGIDFTKFEHNVPKRKTDAFACLARSRLANEPLPTSDIQWAVLRKKWSRLWSEWIASECSRRGGCLDESHLECGDHYARPNFWELTRAFADERVQKERLLRSLDKQPRRRAAKVVDDALARIRVTR